MRLVVGYVNAIPAIDPRHMHLGDGKLGRPLRASIQAHTSLLCLGYLT